MRTLCILTIYNEIKFLPYKLQYCKDNDLDLYVIDNMSNDGSWEWLQDNNIKSHRFDTNGMFYLKALQKEMVKTVHEEKPDWAIYNGCDLFPLVKGSLGKKLEEINKEGYNLATIDYLMFCNTGEERSNPFTTYFHFHGLRSLMMIHKYDPKFDYYGDAVKISAQNKIYNLEGVMPNYGCTKTKEERDETYARRKKAWDAGVTLKGHGIHYKGGKEINWLWEKDKLTDVRNTKYYEFIKNASFYK